MRFLGNSVNKVMLRSVQWDLPMTNSVKTKDLALGPFTFVCLNFLWWGCQKHFPLPAHVLAPKQTTNETFTT